jgi:hypothetical protein
MKNIYEDHPSSIQLLIKPWALNCNENNMSLMNLLFFIDFINVPSILDELF